MAVGNSLSSRKKNNLFLNGTAFFLLNFFCAASFTELDSICYVFFGFRKEVQGPRLRAEAYLQQARGKGILFVLIILLLKMFLSHLSIFFSTLIKKNNVMFFRPSVQPFLHRIAILLESDLISKNF